jgi:uncharacterized protein (DUF58 family)
MKAISKLKKWLLKRVEATDEAVLQSKNIYILPTREGLYFTLLIFIMLAAATNFTNSLIFFFTFLLVGIALFSMYMTQKNLVNLHFSMSHIQPVFCCQPIVFPLVIQHSTVRHQNISDDHYSISIGFAKKKPNNTIFSDVCSGEKTIIHLSAQSQQRGLFQLPVLTISSCYPLGLFNAWGNIQLKSHAIVYPQPSDSFFHIPLDGSNSEGQSDKGRGFDDFSGFKAYQKGEPLNHIHWKAYAREQGLMSKTFSGANNHEYWFNWNDLSGDTELRLSQLCRLIIDAHNKGDRYGLVLPEQRIAISQGITHQQVCLKILALYQVT